MLIVPEYTISIKVTCVFAGKKSQESLEKALKGKWVLFWFVFLFAIKEPI